MSPRLTNRQLEIAVEMLRATHRGGDEEDPENPDLRVRRYREPPGRPHSGGRLWTKPPSSAAAISTEPLQA